MKLFNSQKGFTFFMGHTVYTYMCNAYINQKLPSNVGVKLSFDLHKLVTRLILWNFVWHLLQYIEMCLIYPLRYQNLQYECEEI